MSNIITENIVKRSSLDGAKAVIATIGEDGAPYSVPSPFFSIDEDGRLIHLELLETSATHRNILRSLWFDKPVTVTVQGADGSILVLDYVSDLLIAFAGEMVNNGITLISIGDPTATGEILGPKMFEEYAVRYLNKVVDGIHGFGAPVIVHICGKLQSVRQYLPQLRCDAVSTDALVNLKLLKEEFPGLKVMGNVSTFMLEMGDTSKVSAYTRGLVRDGIDIISPACGLSTSTSLDAIRAMTDTVKGK